MQKKKQWERKQQYYKKCNKELFTFTLFSPVYR